MKEMINNIGNRMVTKARLVNNVLESWESGEISGNLRSNPFYSEFQGMCQLLKAMDMEYDIQYESDAVRMTAIVIMGKTFAV